jgi:hypothetical protein
MSWSRRMRHAKKLQRHLRETILIYVRFLPQKITFFAMLQ